MKRVETFDQSALMKKSVRGWDVGLCEAGSESGRMIACPFAALQP